MLKRITLIVVLVAVFVTGCFGANTTFVGVHRMDPGIKSITIGDENLHALVSFQYGAWFEQEINPVEAYAGWIAGYPASGGQSIILATNYFNGEVRCQFDDMGMAPGDAFGMLMANAPPVEGAYTYIGAVTLIANTEYRLSVNRPPPPPGESFGDPRLTYYMVGMTLPKEGWEFND